MAEKGVEEQVLAMERLPGKGKSKGNKIILHSITQNETDMVNLLKCF